MNSARAKIILFVALAVAMSRAFQASAESEACLREARALFVNGKIDRAREQVNRCPGKQGRFLRAEIAYAQCYRAFESEEYAVALRFCEGAIELGPHVAASKIIGQLEERADKLFLEGYTLEPNDAHGAAERYRAALGVAPRGSVIRSKIERKLKAFGGVVSD